MSHRNYALSVLAVGSLFLCVAGLLAPPKGSPGYIGRRQPGNIPIGPQWQTLTLGRSYEDTISLRSSMEPFDRGPDQNPRYIENFTADGDLFKQGRAFYVTGPHRAEAIQRKGHLLRVRINDGEHRGEDGWLMDTDFTPDAPSR